MSKHARVELRGCVLGGEGEQEMGHNVMLSAYGSVQEQGLRKLACYATVLQDDADAVMTMCELRDCSVAALLVAHRSRARLHACSVSACEAAFISGERRGRALELTECVIEASAKRLWADADRPRALVWGANNQNRLRERRENAASDEEEDEEEEGAVDTTSIVPRQQPRGYEYSDSDDSLEEATFAGMEARMEELDDFAVSEAQR